VDLKKLHSTHFLELIEISAYFTNVLPASVTVPENVPRVSNITLFDETEPGYWSINNSVNNNSPPELKLGQFLLQSDFDFLSEMMANGNKIDGGVGGSGFMLAANQVNINENYSESAAAASHSRVGIRDV
jgi:hypothetical protein